MKPTNYIGRFAPSPTGQLHFGSLLSAVASYADARHNSGRWLLRIDDIDPPRTMPEAMQQIPHTLKHFGFCWDDDIIWQSKHTEQYQRALQALNEARLLYLCSCSRSMLRSSAIYPRFCKPASTTSRNAHPAAIDVQHKLTVSDNQNAIRVIMDASVSFTDAIQGDRHYEAQKHFGDTVVVRRDELFSYALCCAVDDANGITHVVRGSDLLPTTAAQITIMKQLKLAVPNYAHIPVATNAQAQKLSKQTHAAPIDTMPTLPTLFKAWEFLGQVPFKTSTVESFWSQAIELWQLKRIPRCESICESL